MDMPILECEEGANDEDEEEETPVVPSDYERVFRPNHSSMKGMVICDPSHHSSAKTLGRQATKALAWPERDKAPMIKQSEPDSD
ncbi:hypothetical protein PVK06_007705 [Gossypium arboreum]|uniref:Uncharacterized protein n=1 Tax=Gossypium arboreum TaxID=29729 RepID=A0ABR0QJ79_GOSAR|nr:hypothetical protein PVK06_007705 [Gossypium arboreum]